MQNKENNGKEYSPPRHPSTWKPSRVVGNNTVILFTARKGSVTDRQRRGPAHSISCRRGSNRVLLGAGIYLMAGAINR
ncbi:hypothetical protein TNCV_3712131 [Trichonephila clavipes]|nr:hypothetical protein TNCV_3712131 [Trichonephila clavipes]